MIFKKILNTKKSWYRRFTNERRINNEVSIFTTFLLFNGFIGNDLFGWKWP